jgi:uncharacterized protein YggE
MKKNLLFGLLPALVLLLAAGYAGAASRAAAPVVAQVAARGVEQANATVTPEVVSESAGPLRTIKVSGNAQVMVVPDQVILTLGVESWNPKLITAKANNDQIVQNVIGVTKEFNIPAKNVQTDYLNVQPSFDNYEQHALTGYYVRRNVVVTLKDLTQFEDLLSAALEAGVNYVHGIDFRTSQLRTYRDQARDLALQAAKEKAQAMAAKLGQTIGDPLTIEEANIYWYSPYSSYWSYGGSAMSQNVVQNASGPASGELSQSEQAMAPGQIAVGATVNVEFVLK